MKANKLDIVRFAPKGDNSFYDTIKARAKAYFEHTGLSPYANAKMWIKTCTMLLLYFGPYSIIVSGLAADFPVFFLGMWVVAGLGMSGIGAAIMHDANHGTYSPHQRVNRLISHTLEMIGGYTINWKIQHNMLHHTYTNVSGLDEDIDTMGLLRLSPHQPLRWYHRYQHIYAWLLYMIMTLYWMTAKDFFQAARYQKIDILRKAYPSLKNVMWRIGLYKALYYSYIILLPLLFSGMPWYYVIFGFMLMHFTGGLLLSCIFQPAHIMETSDFALPTEKGGKLQMESSWAVHELHNTTNFASGNWLLTWFAGGLNFQIEHHLFTNVCHVHYPKLAPIVKQTAHEFTLPYNEQRTFFYALGAHSSMLKKMGRPKYQIKRF